MLLAAGVVLVLLFAYVAAGPYLAINGIRSALAEQDASALERHVDFPKLRVNMKAHLEDAIVRRGGELAESGGLLGAIGLQVASGLGGAAVDAMVTPLGIGALLQGRGMWKKATGQTVDGDAYGAPQPADPLKDAKLRYESTSRFTATVQDTQGEPVVAVFQRQGLRWRLTDIRFDPPAR
ncbi:MAG TPA: DUF2939 domain-containing protein [Thermomonas sp.]|nr:DUF2939 domain-containing protein [Thermomonas sp.]